MNKFSLLTPILGLTLGCSLMTVTSVPVMAFEFDKKLLAPDGAEGDNFGYSVSVSSDIALIGSYQDDDNASDSGSAYLFDVTTGNLLHKLTVPDGAQFDEFGISVSVSGDTALIGSPGDNDNGLNSGSAYLFDITTGNLLHKLTAPDAAPRDGFGRSVSVSGNTALIGSPNDDDNGTGSGSAYLFDVTTGNFLQKLTAPNGAIGNAFGYSVSVSGNTALIGSYRDDDNGIDSGSAYLFDVTTGNFLQKLTAPDGAADDYFGWSVSVSSDTALIGSYLDDDNGTDSGSAYLFDVTTGNFLQKLTAPDGTADDLFGNSVSVSGNTTLIGSSANDDNGSASGSAYLFTTNTTTTTQVPEPSLVMGLFAVVGLGAFWKKHHK